MSIRKTIAGVVTGAVLATAAVAGLSGAAFASDEDPLIPGGVYWFNTAGPVSSQTAATQITSGQNAANGGNLGTGRPWITLSSENACPENTVGMYSYIRIPQAGVPENDWTQVQVGAQATLKDAEGRFYTTGVLQADRLNKPDVMTYLAAQPGNTGQLPFISVCRDAGGYSLGYFRTLITMTGTTQQNLEWSIPLVELPKPASTTVLAASATSVEAGDSVTLTATVTPAGATGDVEFFAGATSLGVDAIESGVATIATSAIPVGTNSVTAVYAGDATNAGSTSAAVEIVVAPVAPRSTITDLVVSPVDGPAYAPVTMTATVTAATGTPAGSVRFLDGTTVLSTVPVDASGVAVFTSNTLGAGAHSLTAEFVGTAPYTNSAAAAVEATYALAGAVDEQVVDVEIPAGTISITTPYYPAVTDPDTGEIVTPANPLHLGVATLDPADSTYSASAAFEDIVITDSRAGNLGFTASVVSGPFQSATDSFPGIHAGLTGLVATQVPGNALQATNVVLTPRVPFTDGLDVPKVFAQYAAGQTIGTAHIDGVFGVDQVPTSVTPGLYTATVTFTAV